MAFIESPRFPEEVSAWMVGGEEFSTDIAMTNSGSEQRNQVWSTPLRRYRLSNGLRTIPNAVATKAFFRAAGGRANGFRVKDLFDYTVDNTTGILGAGIGSGVPTYQLQKKYVSGSATSLGKIVKPVSGQVAPQRNGVNVTAGAAAGNYSVDTTTGFVTFVPDAIVYPTTITIGTTTTLVVPTNPTGLTAGKKVYLAAWLGNDAALLNNLSHIITSVTGAGPFTIVLSTNTLGKDIAMGGGSAMQMFPQASDTLTWAGQFDIPVRFDMDWMQVGIDTGLMLWDNITLQELRL